LLVVQVVVLTLQLHHIFLELLVEEDLVLEQQVNLLLYYLGKKTLDLERLAVKTLQPPETVVPVSSSSPILHKTTRNSNK